MKKTFYTLAITLLPVSALGQLRVDGNGFVTVNQAALKVDEDSGALLTIGDDENYYWPDLTFYNTGIVNSKVPSAKRESVGLYSEVLPAVGGSRTQPSSTAVWGMACGSSTVNYGVVGTLNNSKGAGIFGTAGIGFPSQLSGTYAGYFDGSTYVNGSLTTSALYNLSDIRLKQNVTLLSETAGTNGNATEHLQRLNVIEYNLAKPVSNGVRNSLHRHNMEESEEEPDTAELVRRHYGLSAQELRGVYPDLVLEGQDGYLAVNYVELVPILIRSIQELKQELDEVKGSGVRMTRSAYAESDALSPATSGNVLYQNTPNPFREQTTIRFRLADDARDAAVCIFDLSGKMLRRLPVSPGMTSVSVNGWELGEGLFLYSLVVGGREIDTKRMMITK